jgi:hypothetical protein
VKDDMENNSELNKEWNTSDLKFKKAEREKYELQNNKQKA